MDMGLEGKTAIITGGSDGIGKAAALSMAKEGANVVIVARRQEVLDQAVQEIKTATEGSVVPLALDITTDGASQKMIKTAVDNFGRVDIIVNNAGSSMAKPFESVSHEDWQSDFELKVWAAAAGSSTLLTWAAGPPDPHPCPPQSPGRRESLSPRAFPRTWPRKTYL